MFDKLFVLELYGNSIPIMASLFVFFELRQFADCFAVIPNVLAFDGQSIQKAIHNWWHFQHFPASDPSPIERTVTNIWVIVMCEPFFDTFPAEELLTTHELNGVFDHIQTDETL